MAPTMPDSKRLVIGLACCILCLVPIYTFYFPASRGGRVGVMVRDLLSGNVDEDFFLTKPPTQRGSGACPILKAPRGCRAQYFPAPINMSSDSDYYQMLDRAFDCIIQHVVTPATAGRGRRKLRNSKFAECNSGQLGDSETTQAEGWRALAEQKLCTLEGQLYPLMTSCRLSRQRGMYVKSSRELRSNMRSLRQCPKGLVICAVVKNEAAYIQEWLAFHLHSGVEHFYLYFNEDEEDTLRVVQPFVDAGLVTVKHVEGGGLQAALYGQCLARVKAERPTAEWIAFHDVDEYLFRTDQGCMMELLATMNDRAALAVNWHMYSHSNHVLQLPRDQLLMESNVHTRFEEDPPGLDVHVKSVVRVKHTVDCGQPHFCVYEPGWHAKDELGRIVEGPFNDPPTSPQQIRMHHYNKRTLQDFLMKRLRGRADIDNVDFSLSSIAEDVKQAIMTAPHIDVEAIKAAYSPVRALLGLH